MINQVSAHEKTDSKFQNLEGRKFLISFILITTIFIVSLFTKSKILFAMVMACFVLAFTIYKYFPSDIVIYAYILVFWFPIPMRYSESSFIPIGMLMSEAIVYFIFIFWMATCAFKYRLAEVIKKLSGLNLGLLVIYILGALVAYFSNEFLEQAYAAEFVRLNCFYAVALYLLIVNIITDTRKVEICLLLLVMGGVVVGLRSWFCFSFYPEITELGQPAFRLGQIPPSFFGYKLNMHSLALGAYLASLVPLSVGLYLSSTRKVIKFFSASAIFLFLYLLLLTGTRSCYVGVTLGMLVTIILNNKYSVPGRRKLLLIAACCLCFYVFLTAKNFLSNELQVRIDDMQYYKDDKSLLERIDIWREFIGLIVSNPLGLGFRPYYGARIESTTAHNTLLSIILGHGLIGALAFIAFIYCWFRKVIIRMRVVSLKNKPIYIAIFSSAITFFFNGMFDSYNLFFLDISFMWIILSLIPKKHDEVNYKINELY